MATVSVLESTIHYVEQGSGFPVVFLHGNPTSSHLWRNVMPLVTDRARALAPDLIGMGASGKPDIAYDFSDHARYLDAWIETLELPNIVLVGHDWGGALALDWSARHAERVRGVALLETMLRPLRADELPPPARERFAAFRTPGVGEDLVLDKNIFIETAFSGGVLHPLSPEEIEPYRAPFPTSQSRRPMLAWPRMMPIDGEPAEVVARIERYDAWLAASASTPKLLMTFEGSPTLLIGQTEIDWCRQNVSNLEIEHCGPAGHHAPEDQPEAIGRAVARWLLTVSG